MLKWFLAICLSLLAVSPALAQNNTGIMITPSIMHLDLSEDPPEYQLTFKNNTKVKINITLSAQDFTALENSYKIQFLEGKDLKNYKYSLASWISFETKNIELNSGENKTIKIFIDKNRITKGGHYASVLAEVVEPENKKQVNIKTVLSSLLFVRASTGQEIEEGNINSFAPLRDGIEFPDMFMLKFENKGNVHVVPYGLIQVLDPLGNTVAKGVLNEGSLDALPESIRRYDTPIKKTGSFLIPGFYKATIDLHFGKTAVKIKNSVNFFSQGDLDFGKIAIILIIVVAGILIFRNRKRTS